MQIYLLGADINSLELVRCLDIMPKIIYLKEEKNIFLNDSIRLESINNVCNIINNITEKNDILIPTTDFWVSFLKDNNKKLKKQIYYKDLDFLDKLKFNNFLEKNSFPYIKIFKKKIPNINSIIKFNPKRTIDYLSKKKTYFISSSGNIPEGFIAQEFIDGDNFSIGGISTKKKIIMGLWKKINERPKNGTGTLVKLFYKKEYNKLFLITQRILKKANYSGPFEIEFIIDKKKQIIKVLEFNPRFWLQQRLSCLEGVNLIKEAIKDLKSNEISKNKKIEIIKPKKECFWINETHFLSTINILIKKPLNKKCFLIFNSKIRYGVNYFFSSIKKCILGFLNK